MWIKCRNLTKKEVNMSFSRQSKIEILKESIEDDTSMLAFLSGLFHSCGEIGKNGSVYFVSIVSDIQELFSYVKNIVNKLYGENIEEKITNIPLNKNTFYEMRFDVEHFQQLLLDVGVIDFSDGISFNFEVNKNLLLEDDARRAFVKGVYIGCSTSSIKFSEGAHKTESTGYHLEFVSKNHEFLLEFSSILATYNIIGKIFERKSDFVFYLKEVNAIIDLLALVGANQSVLELNNELATRELRNKVNRQVNCINANINKTVEASLRQVEAINAINSTIGIESLPEDLQEVAVLRLANQEESLDELIKLSTIKLTRSGLNHRFRKLIKIAKELEE